MNKQPSLKQRIDDALQPDAPIRSSDLAALIEEIEAELLKARKCGGPMRRLRRH
jgi:hypothetical protein